MWQIHCIYEPAYNAMHFLSLPTAAAAIALVLLCVCLCRSKRWLCCRRNQAGRKPPFNFKLGQPVSSSFRSSFIDQCKDGSPDLWSENRVTESNFYDIENTFAANKLATTDDEGKSYDHDSQAMQGTGRLGHNNYDSGEKCGKRSVATGIESAARVQDEGDDVEDTVSLQSGTLINRDDERLVDK